MQAPLLSFQRLVWLPSSLIPIIENRYLRSPLFVLNVSVERIRCPNSLSGWPIFDSPCATRPALLCVAPRILGRLNWPYMLRAPQWGGFPHPPVYFLLALLQVLQITN